MNSLVLASEGSNKFLTFIAENFGIVSVWDALRVFLDIAIVAFAIYEIVKIFKNTRAFALMKSIIIIFVIFYVARVLKLNTVSSALNVILNVLPVLLVVLFAPEIRKILEDVGNKKITDVVRSIWNRGGSEYEQKCAEIREIVAETTEAMASLSASKTGALVVFERRDNVREWDGQGTVLDAKVSSRLLEQIFIDKSPLHDGAVLICGGRIYAAQCTLPNSGNKAISKELGLRHKAAIGASEVKDCVVVVVSEETGVISITKQGLITRGFDAETLSALLLDELLPEKPSEERGRRNRQNPKKKGEGSDASDAED